MLSLLLVNIFFSIGTFAQDKDSLAKEQELENWRRKADSLHKIQLARDSAFRQQLNDISNEVNRSIEDNKQKEVEKATEEVMARHEKEQRSKRQTMLWATAGFLIAVVIGGLIFKRRKGKTDQSL